MKNYFRIVTTIGILFVLGLAIFTIISFSSFAAPSIDDDTVVILNDIAMDAAEDMDSIKDAGYGVEFVVYYGKKGWHPNWHTEPQDSIDFMMENI